MIKVLIIDQHPIFVEGLRLIMRPLEDIECVGAFHDSSEAVKSAKELLPDVIITEVTPPCFGSLDFVRRIKTDLPGIRVMLLSQFYDQSCIKAAVRTGVDSFLLKNTSQDELITAIRMVYSGKGVFDCEVASRIFNILNYPKENIEDSNNVLSNREKQVLSCVALGMSNKAIADQLKIRPNTVACHLGKIYKKLGVDSRTAAAACGIAMDLVSINDKKTILTSKSLPKSQMS